jgi:hypothetical protein
LLNAAALLSLMLCAVSVAFWIRSYFQADYVAPCRTAGERGVISTVGRIVFYSEASIGSFRFPPPYGFVRESRSAPDQFVDYAPSNTMRYVDLAGFGVITGDNGRYSVAARAVPYWLVALMTAILPGTWLRSRMRGAPETSQCGVCGYDLRATPERCPECGSVPAAGR